MLRSLIVLPTDEQYIEIAARRTSKSTEIPFPVLLTAFAASGRTAILRARCRQVEKSIVFERGMPTDCRSNLAHETLNQYLIAAGRISKEAAADAFDEAANRGALVGEILVERGLITPPDLYRALQANLAKKLLDIFLWSEAEFAVLDDPPSLDSPVSVRVGQLILTGTRMSPAADVERALLPWADSRVAQSANAEAALAELKLSPTQQDVIDAFRLPATFSSVLGQRHPFSSETARAAYAFALLGILVPEGRRPRRSVVPLSHRAPTNSAVPASASAQVDDVFKAYLAFRRQDAFDLLGLPEDASVSQIVSQYLRFARRFSPDRFVDDPSDTRAKAEELFLAGATAYAQLADVEKRNSLLRVRNVERDGNPVGRRKPRAIRTDVLDPALHFKRGLALKDEGNLRAALTELQCAADCDPQKGIYRAEAALCRYETAPDDWAKVITELEETHRVDPHCGLGFFYAGQISRAHKDWKRAEVFLRRAAKLMTPDRRPLDALLTMMSEKKK